MTENKYFQKTLATHLTELRDPLLGRDPQFGKPCSTLHLQKYNKKLCLIHIGPSITRKLLFNSRPRFTNLLPPQPSKLLP